MVSLFRHEPVFPVVFGAERAPCLLPSVDDSPGVVDEPRAAAGHADSADDDASARVGPGDAHAAYRGDGRDGAADAADQIQSPCAAPPGAAGRGGQDTQSDAGGGGGTSRRAAGRTARPTVWNGMVPMGSSSSAIRWASMSMPVNPRPPSPRRAGWRGCRHCGGPRRRRRASPRTTIPRSDAPTGR